MKHLTALLASFLLCACTTQTTQTLSEKLSGKNPGEKKEILRIACLSEAEWQQTQDLTAFIRQGYPRSAYSSRYYSEVSNLKTLCHEMTAIHLAKADEE